MFSSVHSKLLVIITTRTVFINQVNQVITHSSKVMVKNHHFKDIIKNVFFEKCCNFCKKAILTESALMKQCPTLDVSQKASYEIALIHLSVRSSVRLSVRPSLSFLKIGSLVFSDIAYDVS